MPTCEGATQMESSGKRSVLGCSHRPVLKRVNVLPRILQFLRPFLRNAGRPSKLALVFVWQHYGDHSKDRGGTSTTWGVSNAVDREFGWQAKPPAPPVFTTGHWIEVTLAPGKYKVSVGK
jgi:hypothetical protein